MRLLILVSLLLLWTGSSQAQGTQEVLAKLGNEPTLGSKNATVGIVEFSDFRCSFCKKFWAGTLPRLKDSYINPGKARFTYRHFAVLGKFSEQAAMAAECAAEQGKFWAYHDRLFGNLGRLAFTQPTLEQFARDLGLKQSSFKQCLTTEKYRNKVEGETLTAATLGARGTPTFFVNSRLLVGAQPFEAFRSVIEEELKKRTTK